MSWGRWAERFRRSVRVKLLALVLAPLLLGVPLLLGLAWTWGDGTYDRLLRFKIGSDLVTAHEYFDRVRVAVGHDVRALAESRRLAARLDDGHAELSALLAALAPERGLDFLQLLDPAGRPIAGAHPVQGGAPSRDDWPAVAAALAGASLTTVEQFSAQELEALSPELRRRARLPLLETRAGAPASRSAESRGLVLHAAAPVHDEHGTLVGVLEGGVLLNGNLGIVDRLNAIVYRDGSLPLGSRGTATLFLDDIRIATNVKLFEGTRALGTRVSRAVRDSVLGRGDTWLDSAFVVNDDYVSGYEPIVNGRGERVGMLYVGFLERPFRVAKRLAMGVLFGLFIAISAAGALLSLRWARSVFEPIERMNGAIQRIEHGDATARVGPIASRDELGRLAGEFDRLLDSLSAKREQLQDWAEDLDRKVAERTAALRDANETLRRAQQQLVMSEKLAAIGELTAGVAHEVNNPIAVIQGNLDVLRDILGPAAAPVGEEIRLIHEQADRIRQIVTKLLQFARPGEFAGYTDAVEVNAVVADCLLLTRHSLDKRLVRVETALAATGTIEMNRSELQQVLINLIINSQQAMPDGGTLTVTTADRIDDGVPAVVVTVRDTGHGIAPEHLANIFDPFFTTKKGTGTGLGLSISYALVERYGGHITVRSAPGEGAEFAVWLRREPRFDDRPGAPGFMQRWKA